MYPSQLDFLRHILDESTYLLKVTNGKNQDEVFSDDTLSKAIVRSIEIIGEATKRLDPDFTAKYPHIEWKKMAGTRDVVIHNYFGVDYDIVWSIIVEKIPDLEYFIRQIIEEAGS